MDKVKAFWAKPIGKITCLGVGFLVILLLLIKVLTPSENLSEMADNMQNTQQGMVNGDVKLTTQETLNTVEGQTSRLTNKITDLEAKQRQRQATAKLQNAAFQKSIEQRYQQQETLLQQKLDALVVAAKTHKTLSKNEKHDKDPDGFVIGNGQQSVIDKQEDNSIQWISDPAAHVSPTSAKNGLVSDSLLHSDQSDLTTPKPKAIPYYTIPENTALIDVRPLQPLIGVIPLDGTVVDPETVLFSIGKKGLLANRWTLPPAIKGVQGSATCTGIFEITKGNVKCAITSLTFIFNDGRISTVTAESNTSLGKLTDHFGNDYIPGILHTNIGWNAAGTGFFSMVQGAGGAFANAQVETNSNSAGTFSNTSIKNAGYYAAGQGLESSGQAFNSWWQTVMKSTTNYVFVPNWDASTHHLLQLNAVITAPVAINYNPTGRKVDYNHEENDTNNSLD